jgi:hypothetical protein
VCKTGHQFAGSGEGGGLGEQRGFGAFNSDFMVAKCDGANQHLNVSTGEGAVAGIAERGRDGPAEALDRLVVVR